MKRAYPFHWGWALSFPVTAKAHRIGSLADMDEFRNGEARRKAWAATESNWREITLKSLRESEARWRAEEEAHSRWVRRTFMAGLAWALVVAAVLVVFARWVQTP